MVIGTKINKIVNIIYYFKEDGDMKKTIKFVATCKISGSFGAYDTKKKNRMALQQIRSYIQNLLEDKCDPFPIEVEENKETEEMFLDCSRQTKIGKVKIEEI